MYEVYKIYQEAERCSLLGAYPDKKQAQAFLHDYQQKQYQERCKAEGVTPEDEPDEEEYLTEDYSVIFNGKKAWGVDHKGKLWTSPDDAELLMELIGGSEGSTIQEDL